MNYQDRIQSLLAFIEDNWDNYGSMIDAEYHIDIMSAIDTSNLSNADKETISDLECYYNIS